MKRFLLVVFLLALNLPAIAQTCATFPCVVASVSLTGQTADVFKTPLYTPNTAGLFRISAYISATPNGTGGAYIVTLGWTDDVGARTSRTVVPPSAADFVNVVAKSNGAPFRARRAILLPACAISSVTTSP